MARVKSGILGPFVGKVGTVVGYMVGDKNYMRGLTKNPKLMTENELINQDKFKLVQDYLSPLKDLIKAGFKGYYFTPKGGYRSAVSYTRKKALVTDDAGFYIDPALVKISGGSIPQAEDPTVVFEAPNSVKISWNKDNVEGDGADQLMVSAYDMESFSARTVVFDGAYRRDGNMLVKIPKGFKGKQIDVYIGFINGDRTAQSDSQYLGRLEIPI